jgi:hypothetical protein
MTSWKASCASERVPEGNPQGAAPIPIRQLKGPIQDNNIGPVSVKLMDSSLHRKGQGRSREEFSAHAARDVYATYADVSDLMREGIQARLPLMRE